MLFTLPAKPTVAATITSTTLTGNLDVPAGTAIDYEGSQAGYQAAYYVYADPQNSSLINAGLLWAQDANAVQTLNLSNPNRSPSYGGSPHTVTGSGGAVNLDQADAVITGSSDVILVAGAHNLVTVNGSAEAVTDIGAQDSLTIGGNGQLAAVADKVSFTQSGAVTEAYGSRVDVSGNGVAVTMGNSDLLGLFGSGDSASAQGTGENVWVGSNGQGAAASDRVNLVDGGTITEVDGSRVDVSGTGVVVRTGNLDNLGIYGVGEVVDANGAGDNVWIGGNGQGAAVTDLVNALAASSISVTALDNSRVDIWGGGVNAFAGNADNLGVSGSSESVTVSGAGDNIWIGGNGASASVVDAVTLQHGGAVHVADASRVSVAGAGAAVQLGAGDNLSLAGTGEALSFGSAIGHASVSGFGSGDQVALQKSSFGTVAQGFNYWAFLLGHSAASGGDTTITIDASDTIVLKGVTLSSANQGQFSFV